MKQLVTYVIICILTLVCSQDAIAQQDQTSITGTVYTQKGEPLAGATVRLVENPIVQTVTNVNGNFEIAAKVGQHLEIKFSGDQLKKVKIYQNNISITVRDNTKGISIGYGQTRSSYATTAAVDVVTSEELTLKNTIMNSENLLYGRIPGLMVLSNAYYKGRQPPGVQFLIRGVGTWRNTAPLLLVDGFEYTSLRTVDPQAIKSISVLKDAAALAIYGQRGANGVILVQTKRGGNHPMEIDFSFSQLLTTPVNIPNMVGAVKYAKARNEALINDGIVPVFSQREIQAYKSGKYPYLYPNVDWFDRALRGYGTQSNYNINFSGGGKTVHYFALLSYSHYKGLFSEPENDTRYQTQIGYGQLNFRSNLDIYLSDNLLFRFNVAAYMSSANIPSEGTTLNDIFSAMYEIPSGAFPVKLPDGTWGGTQFYDRNPLAKIYDTGYGELNTRQYQIGATLRQDLDNWLEGLSAKLMVHIVDYGRYVEGKNKNYQYGNITPVRGPSGNILDKIVTKYGLDSEMDYTSSFTDQERHSALAGMINYTTTWGNDKLDAMLLIQQSSSDFDNINNVHHYRKIAGNIHYAINNTYFFGIAASYAGRNLLPKGERWYFFPAVSAGWLISNETFLQDTQFLDRLKLRASAGITGNDEIPNNKPFILGYGYATGYHFGKENTSQAGTNLDRLPAIDFGIARSYMANVGIEIGLFDHLDIITDLFYAKRKTYLLVPTAFILMLLVLLSLFNQTVLL